MKKLTKDIVVELKERSSNLEKEKLISLTKKINEEFETFCRDELKIPVLTEEEKKIQRKQLLSRIIKESKNEPPIDPKELLEEVKNVIQELEIHCKKYNLI